MSRDNSMDENLQRGLVQDSIHLAQQIIADGEAELTTGGSRALKTRKKALQTLLEAQDQQQFFSSEEISDAFWTLYADSPPQSKTRQHIASVMLAWAQRRDLPFGDAVEAAHSLYRMGKHHKGPVEKQQAAEVFLIQAQWPDLTMKQIVETICALCYASPGHLPEKKRAVDLFFALARRPNLSVEDTLAFITLDSDIIMLIGSTRAQQAQERALKQQMLKELAERSDLMEEQRVLITKLSELIGR